MKNVKIFAIILGSGFVLLLVFTILNRDAPKEMQYIKVERTNFVVNIESKGEIEAASAVTIYLPEIFFSGKIRMHEITLSDIVDEGTSVKKGDYVAQLDNSAVEKEIQEEEADIERRLEEMAVAKIDTAVKLSQERNKIAQNFDNVKEKEIILEQSVYDSKAVQRQAQLSLQQAQRFYENSINSYKRLKIMESNRLKNMQERLDRDLETKKNYETLMAQLTVYAPKDGIVIYAQDRRRRKIKAGSMLNRYSSSYNRVATLPNLDSLLSVTYVNEIDISKVYEGQTVEMMVDALPEKVIKGKIIDIANIGKSSGNSDGKVFRVAIYIENSDEELKPAMTTSNQIIIDRLEDALVIPINAVHSDGENSFVYLRNGINIVKKQVKTGLQNKSMIIIEDGLKNGDKCLIREPANKDEIELVALNS